MPRRRSLKLNRNKYPLFFKELDQFGEIHNQGQGEFLVKLLIDDVQTWEQADKNPLFKDLPSHLKVAVGEILTKKIKSKGKVRLHSCLKNYVDFKKYDGSYKISSPILEQFVEDFRDLKSRLRYHISINNQDSKVLNTLNVMLVDVDLKGKDSHTIAFSQQHALEVLELVIKHHNENCSDRPIAFKVYKTTNGLRYIETNQMWEPRGKTTQRLLQQLYTDPFYIEMCLQQSCFRARVTNPKSAGGSNCLPLCSFVGEYGQLKPLKEVEEVISLYESYTLNPEVPWN